MSDNQPDFDNMTPEEIMAWMETLAKRQGASEGFTTAADMDIAEIDPDSVVIDEPGYVPYGQEKAQPADPPPPPAPPARPAAPAPAQPPPSPVRATQQTQQAPAVPPPVRSTQQTPAASQPPAPPQRPPAPNFPTMLTNPAAQRPPEPPKADPPVDEGALAWLESLAADQGDGLFNLDLSGIGDEVDEAPAAASQPINPMNWLEDLARAQSPAASSASSVPSLDEFDEYEDDYEEPESEKLNPYGEGVNPMEWLETLALRQGANREELTTPARMNIPTPEETEVEDDDYQPFSFDTLPTRRSAEPTAALENPTDWLNSLADAQGYSEEGVRATQPDEDMDMLDIQDAITQGTVTSEQMQYFLDRQADEMAKLPPMDDYDEEVNVETALHPAELPDWLSDLKPQVSAPEPSKSIDALFEAPAASSDMPDWLKQDVLGSDINADLERIFEPEDEPSRPLQPEPTSALDDILVDQNDPWVEALDEEYEQGGMANIDEVPEWYAQNLQDEQRIAVIEGRSDEEVEDTTLAEALLPEESNLTAGQPQAIPAWLGGTEPVMADESEEPAAFTPAAASAPDVFEEMPDWLKEVESAVSPQDVPEWLVESINVEEVPQVEADIFVAPEPEPEPPVIVTPPAPPPRPTPVTPPPQPITPPPARVSTGQGTPVLEGARDKEQSGDLEGALADYEGMIRASADIDAVVADLTQLVKSYKTVPAVYRVLGDGLMRQGKLQAALNTYREALNQL